MKRFDDMAKLTGNGIPVAYDRLRMEHINHTDNQHWEEENEASAEFAAFDRLASMLISVPSEQIRSRLESVKRNKEAASTKSVEQLANGSEAANHRDPD
jgi:hypothetical protein